MAAAGSSVEVSGIIFTWLAVPRDYTIAYWDLTRAAWNWTVSSMFDHSGDQNSLHGCQESSSGLAINSTQQTTYLRRGFDSDKFRVTIDAANSYQGVPLTGSHVAPKWVQREPPLSQLYVASRYTLLLPSVPPVRAPVAVASVLSTHPITPSIPNMPLTVSVQRSDQ